MLSQELGHGGFIAGINPHERGRPGDFHVSGMPGFRIFEAILWCDRLGSVDGWPMAKPET
jgi:hypothetical protein